MATQPLRIAVADDEAELREFFQSTLSELGHEVVAVAENGAQLVGACKSSQPDLAITDIMMPDMDGLDAAKEIYQDQPIPIILVSSYHDPEFIERASLRHILGYLIKPVKAADLLPAISIAMRRFEEFRSLEKEASDLRQALEDRKTIERAKGLIMQQAGLDEPAAFSRLQKLARSNQKKLVEIAQMVIVAAEAITSPDE